MAGQRTSGFVIRFQQFMVQAWYWLRSLRMTGALLAILGVVIVLGLLVPQQPEPDTAANVWVASLPTWLQPWGEPLYFLGLSDIFQSPWFRVPAALLLLHSLIALADYAPLSWKRAHAAKNASSLDWQHPLAQRVEYSIRLPAAPDEFLDQLKESLKTKGFLIDPPFADEGRVVSAARHRPVWFGVFTFYGGLVALSLVFLIGYYYLTSESLTLSPFTPHASQLFDGAFELTEIEPTGISGIITFIPRENGQPSQTLPWQLYSPRLFNMTLLWPMTMEPIISVQAQDAAGELKRLIPLQADLPPATRLNLPLGQTDEPFYFLIPTGSLAFQISPVPASSEGDYNVQVRRKSETSPSENLMVKQGEAFEIDNFLVTISLDHNVKFMARRDWPLLLFFIAVVGTVVASAGLLFFTSPWQLWLVPEVKGRGGQLYGVVEKFGSVNKPSQFLEQLLAAQDSSEKEQELPQP